MWLMNEWSLQLHAASLIPGILVSLPNTATVIYGLPSPCKVCRAPHTFDESSIDCGGLGTTYFRRGMGLHMFSVRVKDDAFGQNLMDSLAFLLKPISSESKIGSRSNQIKPNQSKRNHANGLPSGLLTCSSTAVGAACFSAAHACMTSTMVADEGLKLASNSFFKRSAALLACPPAKSKP